MDPDMKEFLFSVSLVGALILILTAFAFVYKGTTDTPNYTEEYLIKMEKQIEEIERTVNRLELILDNE